MLDAIFDRVADFKTPLWVIIGVLAGGWWVTSWQYATFLPRVEAAELSQQIADLSHQNDAITLEIRLGTAREEVGRLESMLWNLESDPSSSVPGSPSFLRKRELLQRQADAVRYHNCLVDKVNNGASRDAVQRCEGLKKP